MPATAPTPPPAAPAAAPSYSLADLPRGGAAEVAAVSGDDELAQRLLAAGLWPGARVECLGAAPFGDPRLFRLHGYRLALRRSEAARVLVRGAAPGGPAEPRP